MLIVRQFGLTLMVTGWSRQRPVMTRQPLPSHLREAPALIKVRVVDKDVPTPQHVAELIHIQAVCLKVGQHCRFMWREALGGLHQPAAVRTVAGGELDE